MLARAVIFSAVSVLLSAWTLASELHVDPRSLTMNGFATITIALEGDFAATDSVDVPLTNLALVGEPTVSTEFAWINGVVSRRKTFRYRARPLAPGPGRIGPIVLRTPDGRQETLQDVRVDIVADRASGSNDAEVVLGELLATGRQPLFVVAEVDRTSVRTGEPVVVTWMLYNAVEVHQWQIAAIPDLQDFWAEELKRPDEMERVLVGESGMQRVPIRRVVLFPLRSGRLRVDGITIEAAVMRPRRGGSLRIFEGDLVETTFTSAPFEISVSPIPEGPPVDAIGSMTLECSTPAQRGAGPVSFMATLRGIGNLRAAKAPHFDGELDGQWKIEGKEVTPPREIGSIEMARQWEVLLFPPRAGLLEIPPMAMTIFDSASGSRRELRCAQRLIDAKVARGQTVASGGAVPEPGSSRAIPWRAAGGMAILAVTVLAAVPSARRRLALRRAVRDIVGDGSPAEIRARIDARLAVPPVGLLAESSDRGDAYRALRSLLDAIEHDRDLGVDAGPELQRRVRDVLEARS